MTGAPSFFLFIRCHTERDKFDACHALRGSNIKVLCYRF